jgi:amylosucrase
MAYHNSLMVQIWSAIAAKDAKLLELVMSRFGSMPASTAWGVYLRCHDDIGWAIDDTDAHRVGINGHDHRMFLADYYTGKFYGSEARGVDFQVEKHSGERRTSGTAAALTGIQGALERKDSAAVDLAIKRYLCAYAMVFGFGGIPLLYMGDEIALFNDDDFVKDKTKRDDNRWIHRPAMPWDVAESAAAGKKPASTATRVRKGIDNLISARLQLPSLHAAVATKVKAGQGHGVAIFERIHPAGNVIQVYNLAETRRWVSRDELQALGNQVTDYLSGRSIELNSGIELEPYDVLWLG